MGKDKWAPEDLVEWAGGFLDSNWRAKPSRSQPSASHSPPVSVWQPPPPGVVSVCVDAALDSREGKFGTECVLWDHRGWVIASKILVKNVGFTSILAEAFAILGGLQLAAELGCNRIMVLSDCLEVVQAVKRESIPATELGTLLKDIKVSRSLFFFSFRVLFSSPFL